MMPMILMALGTGPETVNDAANNATSSRTPKVWRVRRVIASPHPPWPGTVEVRPPDAAVELPLNNERLATVMGTGNHSIGNVVRRDQLWIFF
jgi:hypothetical protein